MAGRRGAPGAYRTPVTHRRVPAGPPRAFTRGTFDRSTGTTVLLVDPRSRGLAARLRDDGFVVMTADTGHAALACLRDWPGSFDVVVMEVLLPGGLSGYRVLERLRDEGITTPTVLISTKDGEYDQADGLDLGADAYLVKPVSPVVLGAHLRALVRGTSARPARRPFRVGPLCLEPVTRRMTVADRVAELTSREYAMLYALATHCGAVVGKRELYRMVWGAGSPVNTNAVEIYVSYLRKKLDSVGSREMLHTIRGFGYRLDLDPGNPAGARIDAAARAPGGGRMCR
jgi:DNA-binding response OmpR family regulator